MSVSEHTPGGEQGDINSALEERIKWARKDTKERTRAYWKEKLTDSKRFKCIRVEDLLPDEGEQVLAFDAAGPAIALYSRYGWSVKDGSNIEPVYWASLPDPELNTEEE